MSIAELYCVDFVSFAQIEEIWSSRLWPGRGEVPKVSTMLLGGGYDMDIKNHPVTYIALRDRTGNILGVNSCHRTDHKSFRSRGLFVQEAQRGRGLGTAILELTCRVAKRQGASMIWSFPRQSSFGVYEKCGFRRVSDWIPQEETGQVCAYAVCEIKRENEKVESRNLQ